ncbi:hypothetical protein Q6350_03475 [Isoptericola sp. b515]|uniref:hypothetical protein n=1 Tax=Isoptericola sp. b515 TaxID=3064652 RepID=UPI002713905B|nr:hypothetical protein [Isoptericola sp. b515]MDO8147483.1 hypothetical protein [Isoptericola sp. b515]
MEADPTLPVVEPVARKFEAAWNVFAATCGQYVAPEATFQAWFAHYLISQFGIDRVGREPTFRIDTFMDSPWKARLGGSGHARLDAVVTRAPGIQLPHYAGLVRSPDGTGLAVLDQLAVIAELKVASTTAEGLDHTEVAKDVWKLSMMLDEFHAGHPGAEPPLAFACILDNHPTRSYRKSWLDHRLAEVQPHRGVRVLYAQVAERPAVTEKRGRGPEPRRLAPEPGRWDWVTRPGDGIRE